MQPALYESETAEREQLMSLALNALGNPDCRRIVALLLERPRATSAIVRSLRYDEQYTLSLISALDAVGVIGPATGVREPWWQLRRGGLAEIGAYVTGLGHRELRAVVPEDAGRDEPAMPHYRDAFPGG